MKFSKYMRAFCSVNHVDARHNEMIDALINICHALDEEEYPEYFQDRVIGILQEANIIFEIRRRDDGQ